MTMRPPTPGAYLKMRRCAAGLTPTDVAEQLTAEPHVDLRTRAEWIELIEADAQPATLSTIIALRRVYSFDLDVLVALERIAQGSTETPPMICHICGCSHDDPCAINAMIGAYCSWAAPNLCSNCQGLPAPAAIGAAA